MDTMISTPRPTSNGFKVDISRGQRIGRVSSVWFFRPDDERYLSLSELYGVVKSRAERARTRTVESVAIRVEATRDNAERLALIAPGERQALAPTHWSYGQLCSLVGAPSSYMRQLPAPLAAINLQHGLLNHRAEQVKMLATEDVRDGDLQLDATIRSEFASAKVHALKSGTNVIIHCVGNIPGRDWLDGNTVNGSVALQYDVHFQKPALTGTRWKIIALRGGHVGLQCLDNVAGPQWLDGNTVDGSVSLAPETGGRYTGTHWRMHDVAGETGIAFECLGNVPGPKWLDGNTTNGKVSLAPEYGGRYTSAVWHVYPEIPSQFRTWIGGSPVGAEMATGRRHQRNHGRIVGAYLSAAELKHCSGRVPLPGIIIPEHVKGGVAIFDRPEASLSR